MTRKLQLTVLFAALSVITELAVWFGAGSAPYWDGWTWFEWLRQYQAGEASWQQILLWTHNEHPVGVPAVIFVFAGQLFDYDMRPMALASAASFIASGAAVAAVAWRAGVPALGVAAVMLVCLSPRSVENVMTGFQLAFTLTVLCGVAAILLAYRAVTAGSYVALTLMIPVLIIGGWTTAAFFAVYPALVLALLIELNRWSLIGVIGAAVVAMWWLALYAAAVSTSHLTQPDLPEQVCGLLILAGSPLVEYRPLAAALGITVLLAFVFCGTLAWYRGNDRQRVAVSMGLFSLGLVGTIAYGRGLMGGINPSRYSTFGAPLVAMAMALPLLMVPIRFVRSVSIMICAAAALAFLWNVTPAWEEIVRVQRQDALVRGVSLNHQHKTDAEIQLVNPGPAPLLRKIMQMMERNHWNVFAHTRLTAEPSNRND